MTDKTPWPKSRKHPDVDKPPDVKEPSNVRPPDQPVPDRPPRIQSAKGKKGGEREPPSSNQRMGATEGGDASSEGAR